MTSTVTVLKLKEFEIKLVRGLHGCVVYMDALFTWLRGLRDGTVYMVGKLEAVAIPHWFSLFLDIMMYPSIPQLSPQLFFTSQ